MAQNDQELLVRLKDSGLDAQILAKKTVGRERDLDAVRRLQAIKEKNEQQKDLF